jgi:hypothetical protein
MGLISVTFSYVGFQRAETYRFYRRVLRGFLRWHRTKAVWLKGKGKRKAHLIIYEGLVKNAFRMFLDGLGNGGYFQAEHENLAGVLWEAREKDPETAGYLSYYNVRLGDSDEIWCPKDGYRKIMVSECRRPGFQDFSPVACDAWDGSRCIYPQMTRRALAIREAQKNPETKPKPKPQGLTWTIHDLPKLKEVSCGYV